VSPESRAALAAWRRVAAVVWSLVADVGLLLISVVPALVVLDVGYGVQLMRDGGPLWALAFAFALAFCGWCLCRWWLRGGCGD